MGRRISASRLSLQFLLLIIVLARADKNINSSSFGNLLLSTAEEGEGDLLPENQAQNDEILDGGFSSLDSMLQWAIGHSDPVKLKERAQDVQSLSPSELAQRQMEVQELMEKLKVKSDADLMQIALDDLSNSSLSLEDHHRALQELLILVEPLDNANDLKKMGGLPVVIRELNHPDPYTRTTAAWIIGKACQNNPIVQMPVLELGALPILMKMVISIFVEEATKALYAVSSLIRDNVEGQQLFYAEAGDLVLQAILSSSSTDIRLRKKAVFLIGDLAESQLENANEAELPFFSNGLLLKSLVDQTASSDIDLQEKALLTIKSLLLRTTDALLFREICGLDDALERMKQQLQKLSENEHHRDYAQVVESLRSEVELIFTKRLVKNE